MSYENNSKKHAVKQFFIISLIMLLVSLSCSQNDKAGNTFPVGLWQGTFQGDLLSIEFKSDGCVIIISAGADSILFGGYNVNLENQPVHVDLELIEPEKYEFLILIEKVDKNTLRAEIIEGQSTRPTSFSEEVFFMKRAKEHVLPRMKTAEQRDEELKQLQVKEMIWFEGKDHEKLLDVCEALFRHQFAHNASGAQQNAAAYFLSIYEADPPEDLMSRFKDNVPPVKPGSEFQVGSGLKFSIRNIKMPDRDKIEIEGGYYEGNLSSSGNTYILEKKDGSWEVTSDKMNWIS